MFLMQVFFMQVEADHRVEARVVVGKLLHLPTAKASAPSLIVDRYGDHLVLRTPSQGTEARKNERGPLLDQLISTADASGETRPALPLPSSTGADTTQKS
jgi:hypothetical protein